MDLSMFLILFQVSKFPNLLSFRNGSIIQQKQYCEPSHNKETNSQWKSE